MLNRAVDFHPQRHTLTSIRSPPLQGRTGCPGPTDDHLSAGTSHGVPLQQIQRPDKFTDSWPRNDEKSYRIYFTWYYWIYLWRILFRLFLFRYSTSGLCRIRLTISLINENSSNNKLYWLLCDESAKCFWLIYIILLCVFSFNELFSKRIFSKLNFDTRIRSVIWYNRNLIPIVSVDVL